MQVPDDIQIIMGQLHFEADAHWVDGQYDRPEALVAAFKDQPGLEDYTDESDNVQSAVRLDVDPDGAEGFWVLVPKGTKTPVIKNAVAAYPEKVTELDAEIEANRPKTQSELLIEAIDKLPADQPLTKEDLLSVLTV
jgi:hypothetical protein